MDYRSRRWNRPRLWLMAGTVLLLLMPLLPYGGSGGDEGVALRNTAVAQPNVPLAPSGG